MDWKGVLKGLAFPIVGAALVMGALALASPTALASDGSSWPEDGEVWIVQPDYELVFDFKRPPARPTNCSQAEFLRWKEVPNTIQAAVLFRSRWSAPGGPIGKRRTFGPEFEDTYKAASFSPPELWHHVAPEGYHWILMDGLALITTAEGDTNCQRWFDDFEQWKASAPKPTRFFLRLKDSTQCTAAHRAIIIHRKAVKRWKARVRKLSGKRRRANKRKLKKIRADLKKAERKLKKTRAKLKEAEKAVVSNGCLPGWRSFDDLGELMTDKNVDLLRTEIVNEALFPWMS